MIFAGEITVTLASSTRTTDAYDNYTEAWTLTPIAGCLFEPEQSTERTDPRSPGVTSPARLYMPETTPALGPHDVLVLPPGAHLDVDDHLVLDGEAWSVQGNVERWPQVVASLTRWEQAA